MYVPTYVGTYMIKNLLQKYEISEDLPNKYFFYFLRLQKINLKKILSRCR